MGLFSPHLWASAERAAHEAVVVKFLLGLAERSLLLFSTGDRKKQQ